MADQDNRKLAHTTYFELAKEYKSDQEREADCKQLIELCKQYLADHSGQSEFRVGPRDKNMIR